jgi:hypothetical protein
MGHVTGNFLQSDKCQNVLRSVRLWRYELEQKKLQGRIESNVKRGQMEIRKEQKYSALRFKEITLYFYFIKIGFMAVLCLVLLSYGFSFLLERSKLFVSCKHLLILEILLSATYPSDYF